MEKGYAGQLCPIHGYEDNIMLVVRAANERGSPPVMELLYSGGGRGHGLHGGHLTTNAQHYLFLCVCGYREVHLN